MSILSFLFRQMRSEVRVLIINRTPYTSQRCVPSGDDIHNQDRLGGLFILHTKIDRCFRSGQVKKQIFKKDDT
jgi:hypothetical protein